MKLNQDCVRDILLDIEKNASWNSQFMSLQTPDGLSSFSSYKKFGHDTFLYTIDKLREAKLINASPMRGSDTLSDYLVNGLTWDGHNFLDTIRDPIVWSKTKKIASHLESVSITLLSNIGTGVINHMIDRSFLS